MPPKSVFHLDAEDYVHVIQTTGSPVTGRFDGVDYLFADGIPSEPIHWRVAHHIFGFRGTPEAKMNALHRLGWLNRMEAETALDMLQKCVSYQPLELLPKGVVEFKRPEPERANEASQPVMPTAGEAPPVGSGEAPVAPPDPLRRAKKQG